MNVAYASALWTIPLELFGLNFQQVFVIDDTTQLFGNDLVRKGSKVPTNLIRELSSIRVGKRTQSRRNVANMHAIAFILQRFKKAADTLAPCQSCRSHESALEQPTLESVLPRAQMR